MGPQAAEDRGAPRTAEDREQSPPREAAAASAPPEEETPLLTAEQRSAVLEFLLRGASPAGACQQLGASVFSFERTYSEDSGFRRQVDHIPRILSRNVASALYREAMGGNVSAQSFWLRALPPPGWNTEQAEPEGPRTFDEFFDQLSDHELLQLARAMGVDLPPEIERSLSGTGGGEFSGGVSP